MRDWRDNQDGEHSRESDIALLKKVLAQPVTPDEKERFADMLTDLTLGERWKLSEKQRDFARQLVSSGRVSRQTRVETLDILKPENLPKRPPPLPKGK